MDKNKEKKKHSGSCHKTVDILRQEGIRYSASACLCGIACRYDGQANTVAFLKKSYEEGLVLALCPEILGGLPTPRTPAEIKGAGSKIKVYNSENCDVTDAFQKGAEIALQKANAWGEKIIVLKSKSPSCGVGTIYDGCFTGTLVSGNGVAAQTFLDAGYCVLTEKDLIDEL